MIFKNIVGNNQSKEIFMEEFQENVRKIPNNILYQDLDWLKNQKQSSERDHIIQIIENLISNASRI